MAGYEPQVELASSWNPPATLDEARARARERFRSRLVAGETVGGCGCDEDDAVVGGSDGSPELCLVGVRFRDSGSVYYFQPGAVSLELGDWVVVATARGDEAGRVVIAPHQVRQSLLQGEPGKVLRRLDEDDIARMEAFRRGGSGAVRLLGDWSRARGLGIKPIAGEYSYNGDTILLSYSVPERDKAPDSAGLRALAQDLARELHSRVELRQVGPRDEARLLGGLGRCGRTLCCSSWLPVFPEISMSMAKTQDLPLNPSKVSGVCGRLLCCLSYENEQYRQMKAVMPKLGQEIETPGGSATVMSMHLLKELVTVRLADDNSEVTFSADELGLGSQRARSNVTQPPPPAAVQAEPMRPPAIVEVEDEESTAPVAIEGAPKRRRRRGKRRGTSSS